MKPEASAPTTPRKKPPSTGAGPGGSTASSSGGSAGGGRRGLGLRQGLTAPGGDKPMLGGMGDKPTLGPRQGLGPRAGLGAKMGMGMAGGMDKPVLGGAGGPGDRRPTLGAGSNRPEPAPVAYAGATAPPRSVSFTDTAPIEDFSEDMALNDVFADPTPPADPASAIDDDFALPDSDLFDERSEAGPLANSVPDFSFDDDPPAAPAPQIGDFTFDSDEDTGGGAASALRPDYAQSPPAMDFSEDFGEDPFDFGGNPTSQKESGGPTLGDNLFDSQGGSEDLFGGGGDDLFSSPSQAEDLFGDTEPSGVLPVNAEGGSLFDDEAPGTPGGMFDGEQDPFANLFNDSPGPDSDLAGDQPRDLFFEDASAAKVGGVIEDDLFGGGSNPAESRSIPISVSGEDDLFGGSGDDLFGADSAPNPSQQSAFSPTINKQTDDGLFGNDGNSNDLFGDDDLFAEPTNNDAGLSPGFANPNDGGGLFDVPVAENGNDDLFSGTDSGGLDLDANSDLDAPLNGGLDLNGGDLFGDSDRSQGMFETASSDDGGLFGGAGNNDDLFGGDTSDDLFGGGDLSGALGAVDMTTDNFGANGASHSGGLFDGDSAPSGGGGLFESPDSGSDTMFDFGGSADSVITEPDATFLNSGDNDLFGGQEERDPFADDGGFASGGDDLFGGTTDSGSFGALEPARATSQSSQDFSDDGGSLFGDFSAAEEERDDIRLPLNTDSLPDDLFGDGNGDGALFESSGQSFNALACEEPNPISIPEPQSNYSSVENDPQGHEDLFGEGDDLFGGGHVQADDNPPPLDLDFPMPGDAPIFMASGEPASAPVEPAPESLFGESSDGSDLFDDGLDAPLDFAIPEPSDEPAQESIEAREDTFSPPPSEGMQSAFETEPISFDIPDNGEFRSESNTFDLPEPVSTAAPVAVSATEPVEEEDDLMGIFDSTMPTIEEDPPLEIAIPEADSVAPVAAAPELDIDIPVDFGSGEDLFEPSLERAPSIEEPVPGFEEPVYVEPEPVDLLSAEEKAEIAQTTQADNLEASLTAADAASRIAAYRKALEEYPDNLVLRTRLADIHLKYGLLEDAVVQYRQVLRRNPDSKPLLHRVIQAEFWNENYTEAGDSLLALAKLHLKHGEQHEALDTLQSVLSLDPLHFEARKELVSVFTALDDSKLAAHHLRQLAETALTKGEVQGAISAFQQLLEISADPTFEERLAQIYEGQGDVVKALSSFQSLVGRYRAEERWEEAARVTERIVELAPDQLEDREALISLYQRLGHSGQAVEQQFQLARRYQERRDLERAISLYEEVLRYQVDNHEARRYLVDAYLDAGRVGAALEQAEALTEHYLDTKDHNTAIYLYSRLVDADPENVELQERLVKFYGLAGDPENAKSRWIGIADLHERNGRYERAAEAVQKALEFDESQLDLLYRLALLYAEKIKDNQSALTALRKLFQLAPDRTDAVKMYIDLLLKEEQVSEAGQVLQRLEQAGGESVEIKANVIALLKSSVEANPADLKARFNYGELCYHLGDLDHAIEQFQQTRKHPDFELMSYNMLGLCFASKRGYMMLDLAIKQFQKGLESKGRSEQDYLEIRYNLAMVQYQNGRAKDALAELKECYNVDIAYRDVRSWIQKIEGELASGS